MADEFTLHTFRQMRVDILELLERATPTLNSLHTRMSADPAGWLDSLDEFERMTIGMTLSLAAFSVSDLKFPRLTAPSAN